MISLEPGCDVRNRALCGLAESAVRQRAGLVAGGRDGSLCRECGIGSFDVSGYGRAGGRLRQDGGCERASLAVLPVRICHGLWLSLFGA